MIISKKGERWLIKSFCAGESVVVNYHTIIQIRCSGIKEDKCESDFYPMTA